MIDAVYTIVNGAIDKGSSNCVSSCVTGAVSILTNNSLENIGSTLVSSIVNDVVSFRE